MTQKMLNALPLPDNLKNLLYSDKVELRPCLSTNIGKELSEKLLDPQLVPEKAMPIVGNLIHAIKLIASKVLPNLPISGNVKFEENWEEETILANSPFKGDIKHFDEY